MLATVLATALGLAAALAVLAAVPVLTGGFRTRRSDATSEARQTVHR